MIDELIRITNAKRCGDGWLGKCLAHDDHRPSFSFTERDGRYLFRCHTGCDWTKISEALKARGLKITGGQDKGWETVYTIRDIEGKAIAQHVRVDTNEGKKVFWRGPNGERKKLADLGLKMRELPLYRTETLAGARPDRGVIITEGESSADALAKLDFLALGTVTGAASAPGSKPLRILEGRRVVLWPDNDADGARHMKEVASTLSKLKIKYKLIEWPDAPKGGDAGDFVALGGTADEVRAMVLERPAGLRQLWEGVREAMSGLERYERGDFADKVQTGITLLDRRMRGGMSPGTVMLLGAATGVGKTAIMQQIASHAATKGPVLLVTPEMSLPTLAEREVIREAGYEVWDRNPWRPLEYMRAQARTAHENAAEKILSEKRPIFVLDKMDATMADVEEMARALEGLRLIIIDYAQKVVGETNDQPRYLQVGDVAARGIALGVELGIPVAIASQVNVETRGKRRFFSFRESAILEHSAHMVLVFDVEMRENDRGFMEPTESRIICLKNRTGPTFRLNVDYEPALCRVTASPAAEEVPEEVITTNLSFE